MSKGSGFNKKVKFWYHVTMETKNINTKVPQITDQRKKQSLANVIA